MRLSKPLVRAAIALSIVTLAAVTSARPAIAQTADPTFDSTIAELIPLCVNVRNVRQFNDEVTPLGWKYDFLKMARIRQLPFGEVTLRSDNSFACIITVRPAPDAIVDVPAAVEMWARTNDRAAQVLKLGSLLTVTGDKYILRAEPDYAGGTISISLH